MHRSRVIVLVVIVARSWSFVWFWDFPLLFKFAEVLDLGFAELCKLFIEFWHYFWSLSDRMAV
jgi:hypothetical protein